MKLGKLWFLVHFFLLIKCIFDLCFYFKCCRETYSYASAFAPFLPIVISSAMGVFHFTAAKRDPDHSGHDIVVQMLGISTFIPLG